MYYFKIFILYSIIGFIFESTIFKISKKNKHSGVLYGPYTFVYGFGGIAINYINSLINIKSNFYLNYLMSTTKKVMMIG